MFINTLTVPKGTELPLPLSRLGGEFSSSSSSRQNKKQKTEGGKKKKKKRKKEPILLQLSLVPNVQRR